MQNNIQFPVDQRMRLNNINCNTYELTFGEHNAKYTFMAKPYAENTGMHVQVLEREFKKKKIPKHARNKHPNKYNIHRQPHLYQSSGKWFCGNNS